MKHSLNHGVRFSAKIQAPNLRPRRARRRELVNRSPEPGRRHAGRGGSRKGKTDVPLLGRRTPSKPDKGGGGNHNCDMYEAVENHKAHQYCVNAVQDGQRLFCKLAHHESRRRPQPGDAMYPHSARSRRRARTSAPILAATAAILLLRVALPGGAVVARTARVLETRRFLCGRKSFIAFFHS